MNIYDLGDRKPKVDRDARASVPSNESITPSIHDEFWPTQLLFGVLKEHSGYPVLMKLSVNQLEVLKADVATPDAIYPGPWYEATTYPNEWRLFIEGIKESMPAFAHHNNTMGGWIKALRGYHWQGGWLAYRPKQEVKPVPTDYDLEELGL